MVDEKNFRDPMYEDPTPRQQGNTLSPASRHEHPDSSTSSSEIPYPNSHREESIMNLDLEKGGVEHPVQDVLNNDEKDEFSSSEDKENVGDPNLVDWEGPDDPAHPQNWSFAKKARITISLGVMTLTVTFASSVFSTATKAVSEEFGISTEVATLGTSLFVLGYALGVCTFPISFPLPIRVESSKLSRIDRNISIFYAKSLNSTHYGFNKSYTNNLIAYCVGAIQRIVR